MTTSIHPLRLNIQNKHPRSKLRGFLSLRSRQERKPYPGENAGLGRSVFALWASPDKKMPFRAGNYQSFLAHTSSPNRVLMLTISADRRCCASGACSAFS